MSLSQLSDFRKRPAAQRWLGEFGPDAQPHLRAARRCAVGMAIELLHLFFRIAGKQALPGFH